MGQFSSFDELPVVVHDAILRSLASPRNVANLIRASPGALQAYMTGGRKSVFLATMQNLLSLENQQLMNLIMAAPHYLNVGECYKGTSAATDDVELDGVTSGDDFKQAVHCSLQNFHLGDPTCPKHTIQHLTLKTLDFSIRLFVVMDKAIQTYSNFTMARAQRRINTLGGPQAFTSLSIDCRQPAPDDRETQRLWRGFLLYELFCVILGKPQVSAKAAGNWHYMFQQELTPMINSFQDLPTQVLEEFMCVREYVQEQYELQVNQVLERFRFAVNGTGRRFSGTRSWNHPWTLNRTPLLLSETKSQNIPQSLRYMVNNWFVVQLRDTDTWIDSIALLGPGFLQDFLSQDATARLDFFRATVPLLVFNPSLVRARYSVFSSRISLHDLKDKRLDLDEDQHDISTDTIHRLRAVGWIFWDNPDRLSSMSLLPGRWNAAYGRDGAPMIYSSLANSDGFYLDERPREPEGWESVARELGTLVTQDQHDKMARLFREVGSLRFSEVTSVLTGSRNQAV